MKNEENVTIIPFAALVSAYDFSCETETVNDPLYVSFVRDNGDFTAVSKCLCSFCVGLLKAMLFDRDLMDFVDQGQIVVSRLPEKNRQGVYSNVNMQSTVLDIMDILVYLYDKVFGVERFPVHVVRDLSMEDFHEVQKFVGENEGLFCEFVRKNS